MAVGVATVSSPTQSTSFHRPPPLSVNTSDALLLHVTNSLDVPTTLHHHGMYFNSTSWMDGAALVSQWYGSSCALVTSLTSSIAAFLLARHLITSSQSILPDNTARTGLTHTHTYDISTSTPCQADLFPQGQYVDGFRAPLVLHPSTETYQYDEEFTVILGDWYHQQHAELLQSFISIGNPAGNEPIPGNALSLSWQTESLFDPSSVQILV